MFSIWRAGRCRCFPGSLDLPLVVKPRNEGSAVGVSDRAQPRTVDANHDRRIGKVCRNPRRRILAGREFTCGVLGADALPVVEIIPNKDEFYTYEAKYARGGSTHIVPAKIDEDLAARMQMLALSVHRLIGLRDYSRTDFIVTKEGRPYILEINTLPGLTPTSLFPDACARRHFI